MSVRQLTLSTLILTAFVAIGLTLSNHNPLEITSSQGSSILGARADAEAAQAANAAPATVRHLKQRSASAHGSGSNSSRRITPATPLAAASLETGMEPSKSRIFGEPIQVRIDRFIQFHDFPYAAPVSVPDFRVFPELPASPIGSEDILGILNDAYLRAHEGKSLEGSYSNEERGIAVEWSMDVQPFSYEREAGDTIIQFDKKYTLTIHGMVGDSVYEDWIFAEMMYSSSQMHVSTAFRGPNGEFIADNLFAAHPLEQVVDRFNSYAESRLDLELYAGK